MEGVIGLRPKCAKDLAVHPSGICKHARRQLELDQERPVWGRRTVIGPEPQSTAMRTMATGNRAWL